MEDEFYEVEALLDCRFDPTDEKKYYLVKWAGYSNEDCTWEPADNLQSAANLIRKFDYGFTKDLLPKQRKERRRRMQDLLRRKQMKQLNRRRAEVEAFRNVRRAGR